MMKKIGKDTSIMEHKTAQETINKAGEALGVIDKGGSSTVINNANAQSETKSITIIKAEDNFV